MSSPAKRDISDLKDKKIIRFVGSLKTAYYVLDDPISDPVNDPINDTINDTVNDTINDHIKGN